MQTTKAIPAGRTGSVDIETDRCKGCGICVASCPRHVLVMSTKLNARGYAPAEATLPEGCTGCGLCAIMCPDTAIRVYRRKRRQAEGKGP